MNTRSGTRSPRPRATTMQMTTMSDSGDAVTPVAVLAVISALAIVTVIVMCAIYVCKVRMPNFLQGIFNKTQLKSGCCKTFDKGCCVNNDRQALMNPDTPTTVTSVQENSVSPVDEEPYSLIVQEDPSSDLYTNSPAIIRDTPFQVPANGLMMDRTKLSPLARMRMLSSSESALFHKRRMMESGTSGSDRKASGHDDQHLSADNVYSNQKAMLSKSTLAMSEETTQHLYSHLHEFSSQSVNIYEG